MSCRKTWKKLEASHIRQEVLRSLELISDESQELTASHKEFLACLKNRADGFEKFCRSCKESRNLSFNLYLDKSEKTTVLQSHKLMSLGESWQGLNE